MRHFISGFFFSEERRLKEGRLVTLKPDGLLHRTIWEAVVGSFWKKKKDYLLLKCYLTFKVACHKNTGQFCVLLQIL